MMEQIAEDVWVVEGETVSFFSMPYTTRMTIIRLANKQLWLHSPINLTDGLVKQVEALGQVSYLVAPNHLHHLFIQDWQRRFPQAVSYATDELIKKRADLKFDHSLDQAQSLPWQRDISQLMFTGSPAMRECVFFHHPSSLLLVTDLIENFAEDHFHGWRRWLAKKAGLVAPNGGMPADWRLSFICGRAQARGHIRQMLAWQPKVIVMAHGMIITSDAQQFLQSAFRWLRP